MKLNFSRSVGRLRTELLLLVVVFILSPLMALGTDSIYINTGTINGIPPNVDATNFYNSGTWNISTALPYQTANTLNYTNENSMIGSVGWEFDFGPSGGPRSMAANFFNDTPGTIQATDGTIGNPPAYASFLASYLLVSATNLVNKGTLVAGANGQIVLNGGTVNLSRSRLLITNSLAGGGFINGTNFALDTGLYSESWGQSTMPTNLGTLTLPIMFSSALWIGGTNVSVPTYAEQDNCSTNYFTGPGLSFGPTVIDSIDNKTNPTNEFRQAVFVKIGDSSIIPTIRFTPSSNPTNYFETVAVQLAATLTNPFTLSAQTSAVYVVDMLGSETNRGLDINTNFNPSYTCSGHIYQPANYIVSRSDQILPRTGLLAFGSGSSGAGSPSASFFHDPTMVNDAVSNLYSAYTVFVDDLAAHPATAVATNLPGRIQITANNLDLTRTWLGAQGSILIQASNLVSSAGAVVDCQNLSFNFGSTNGFLNLTNMAKQEVSRLRGTLNIWSAIWTNSAAVTAGTNTNTYTIAFAVTVVDASGLASQVPVTVQSLVLHSTNSTISDSLTVDQTLLLDGQNFTLLGELFLSGTLQDWTAAQAPNLRYFTNDGVLFVPNNAHFGDDTTLPYTEFVNQGVGSSTNLSGVIVSAGQTIRSLDLQIINGINYAVVGNFSATARSIEITGPPPSGELFPLYNALVSQFGFSIFTGQIINALINNSTIYSARDIQFFANTVLIDPAAFYANGALDFTVTNSLSDNGAANTFVCQNGFNLWIKPQTGDLLGTTITSIAPGNAEVDHAWAVNDLGPAAGFSTNVGIGRLVLSAQSPSSLPLFHFYGTTGSNAMYVGTLDLSQLTPNSADVASMIQIDPGMKIYFSQVILGFTPPGGQTPEGFLQTLSLFPGQTNQFVKVPNTVVSQSGSVDWNTVYQPIDGFGASSAWQHTWTSAQADMFFSTNSGTGLSYNGTNFSFNGIGLSLLRNHIAYANTPLATDTPSTVETNIMLMAQARGAKVWSTPWTPAAGFKSINDIYDANTATGGGLFGGSYLGSGNNATNLAYASQLANYVYSMSNTYHVNIYAISIQNEPDANVTSYEACQWSDQQVHDFVTNLYAALVAKGVGSTKIIIPEGQSWQGSDHFFTSAMSDPAVAADVGIVANHNYNLSSIPIQLPSLGKPAWETETANLSSGNNNGIADGMFWANRIYLFMTVAQANAWHFWWLIGASGIGYDNSNQGLADTNGVPAKRMYVLGQFSRFVRPGYERIGVNTIGSSLLVTAFKATNSPNFAIVAINTNGSVDVSQTFSLANFPAAGTVTPWITSSTNSLAIQAPFTVSSSSFTYTIPAQSVVTFVGQGTAPANITISSTAYNPSGPSFVLTWNSTAGATYSVLKTNVLGGSSANWPAIKTNYPPGTAVGGPLSYTDTTATVSPAFYRVSSP